MRDRTGTVRVGIGNKAGTKQHHHLLLEGDKRHHLFFLEGFHERTDGGRVAVRF